MGDNIKHPIQRWPERSPLDMIPIISSYVKGKTVCDIGCGAGDLLYEMRRLGLTDDIIGIENDDWVHWAIKEFETHDREFLINADFTSIDIPEADVYLIWVGFVCYEGIIKRLPPSVIIDTVNHFGDGHKETMSKLTLVEKITYDYNEEPYCKKGKLKNRYNRDTIWSLQGQRTITVYEKKKD